MIVNQNEREHTHVDNVKVYAYVQLCMHLYVGI